MVAFYRDLLGFKIVRQSSDAAALSPDGLLPELFILLQESRAPARPPQSSGLFHAAILYPNRASLGRIAHRLIQEDIRFTTGDHGVSEALYLDDAEGNGVELYADRPVEVWPKPESAQDAVGMYTRAVNLPSLIQEGEPLTGPLMPPSTRLGHLHLCVADLADTERFYTQILPFQVMVRSYPGALFFGRDGYHHHLGVNVWRSRFPASAATLGLARFTLHFTEGADFARAVAHIGAAAENPVLVRDPNGIELRLRSGP